jgi:hypothetical protein
LKQSQRCAFMPRKVSLSEMLRRERLDIRNRLQFISATATQHDQFSENVLKLQRYMFSFTSVIH